ncbi:hypothetical protein [Catenuloplanes atrovinosus]|uniref:Uncharacterized protein n=1 Tax=Catenuloplanes atrovinosus TaxID=137266 RepID=A0AAE4C8L8_9ACTN|nr:hypothetical protein [Catenuloplanes atrovinosus]MDR7275666.1 hypothetical protein [Catenuloplanes atrovinosus]
MPLSQIGAAGPDGDVAPEVLREVDAVLSAEVERLSKARSGIAVLLRDSAPDEPAAGSGDGASPLPAYTQFFDEDALKDLRRLAEAGTDPVSAEIAALPPDADEATRQDLADRLAPIVSRSLLDHPWLRDPAGHLSGSEHVTQQTFLDAVSSLYNPAQLDVLRRAGVLAAGGAPPPPKGGTDD